MGWALRFFLGPKLGGWVLVVLIIGLGHHHDTTLNFKFSALELNLYGAYLFIMGWVSFLTSLWACLVWGRGRKEREEVGGDGMGGCFLVKKGTKPKLVHYSTRTCQRNFLGGLTCVTKRRIVLIRNSNNFLQLLLINIESLNLCAKLCVMHKNCTNFSTCNIILIIVMKTHTNIYMILSLPMIKLNSFL